MKNIVFCLISSLLIICNSHAQVHGKRLTGKWKFVKMEMPGSIGFDLDDLTTSYKKFFEKQKQDTYHGAVTTNDSLYIHVLFEQLVNDVNRMFISFTGKYYETNGYDKSGNMTEKTETGTYFFDKRNNMIYTYRKGNKKLAGSIKVNFLNETKLAIIFDHSPKPAVFTCRKISE